MNYEQIKQAAFMDEMQKLSDMMIGPRQGSIVSGGIFASSNTPEEAKSNAEEIQNLLKQHGSVRAAREAFQKAHPNEYTTTAFKRETAPSHGIIKRIFKGKKFIESEQNSFKERSSAPRIFVRSGPSGGYDQRAFYNEVARGYYDRELDQPHIAKKNRIIYV